MDVKILGKRKLWTDEVKMNKAVLIMDMPENCRDCAYFGLNCKLTNIKCNYFNENGRSEHCPLSLLPKKDNENYFPDEWHDGYVAGWNACLDKILGKEN